MLFSLALILLCGLGLDQLFRTLKLPGLLGMLLTGVILGPHILNLIDPNIMLISADLREIALIIILTRAGLALNIDDLKKVGRPAILMCFIPATLELGAITLFAPMLFDISTVEAAILGSVVAAVSPAVVVPKMLRLMDEEYGKDKSIPQLVMAAASVDDIYVIVLFTTFLGLYKGQTLNPLSLLTVPSSIVIGLAMGIIVGFIMVQIFKRIHMRDTVKMLLIFCISFLFITLEEAVKGVIPVSGLLAIMAFSGTILETYEGLAKRLSSKFSKLWVGAEIFLFVLVGAEVDITTLSGAGFVMALIIIIGLVFRMCGVGLCLIKTQLNKKERVFCAISYLPKATVQAAIGAIPLAQGVKSGNLILTVAVLAIFITAPIGAIGIEATHKKYLKKG